MPTGAHLPLFDQFIFSRTQRPVPAHFETRSLSGWFLASSPTLPVTILTLSGAAVGVLLGWAVCPDGSMAHDNSELAVPDPGDVSLFEDFLYTFAGRWACILTAGPARCYLDPAGSLAAIYSDDDETLASTSTLLRWGEDSTLSQERFEARTLGKNQAHLFGMTSDRVARRLLPNHVLDLELWRDSRHWPREPIIPLADGPGHAPEIAAQVAIIASATAQLITALSQRAHLFLPLTAGRDSRMLLAAARTNLENCTFVTFDYSDHRHVDVTFARAIAHKLGLSHRVLTLPPVSDHDKKTYLETIGFDASEGKARDFFVAARALPSQSGWLTGFAGEVGRSYYWHRPKDRLTSEQLLERHKAPRNAAEKAARSAWAANLPGYDAEHFLDLFFIEQAAGSWSSPQLYGAAPFVFNIMPLNQRAIFTAMLRLPKRYRWHQKLAPAIAAAAWPELSRFAFGRGPGPRGWFEWATIVGRQSLHRARVLSRVLHRASSNVAAE